MARGASSRSARYGLPAEIADLRTESGPNESSALRAPPPARAGPWDEMISLRPLKEFVQKLNPDHPLRVVLMAEPDEIDRDEYYVKLTVWLRLLPNEGS